MLHTILIQINGTSEKTIMALKCLKECLQPTIYIFKLENEKNFIMEKILVHCIDKNPNVSYLSLSCLETICRLHNKHLKPYFEKLCFVVE